MSKQEVQDLTLGEYFDYCVVLDSVLKLWHAPFMPHDET